MLVQAMSSAALVRRMLGLGWRYRGGCIRVLAQQTVLVLMGLAALQWTGLGIDYLKHRTTGAGTPPHWPLGFAPPADWSPLSVTLLIAGGVLLVALAQTWLRYHSAVTVAELTQRIVVQLRADVYDKLQRLSFRFYNQHESGSIINRVTGDVQAVRMFIDGVIIQVVVVAVSLLVYLAYMLSVHVPLTLACLATTPLLWMGTVRFSRLLRPAYRHNRELVDKLVLTLSENVQGVHVVKGFSRENEEIAKFAAANRRVLESKWQIFWRLSVYQPVIGLLTQLNLLVLLLYGGYLVMEGSLRLGDGLFVFANLLQQFATQIGQIANISNSIQTSLIGAQRVFEVLDAPLEIESRPNARHLPQARGAITFDHVAFGYRDGRPVLSDIDLHIEAGEVVALVGPTGAGKSTLLSLVSRFYDPDRGRVLIDGIDARELDLDDLRRNVAVVFQENFLFSHTVAANIAFGRPDAAPREIESAAHWAAAARFIAELPAGYESVVGEQGSNLSGGQRQRLSIARAALLDAPILILDDATTAIDPQTEHEILSALETSRRGRTTLVVAHRLSTLRRADRVVVLDSGRIVQMGTHDQLLARPGLYRTLMTQQAEPLFVDGWKEVA
jgi:ABC-type multidrug transport system fused ATPase/permease subunit